MNRFCVLIVILVIDIVLSAPQGYNYYTNSQRIQAQRLQAQRLQAQRLQAQRLQAQRLQAQNRYKQTRKTSQVPANRADNENAKFLGVQNQEPEEKTLNFIRRRQQQALFGDPCYFRSANQPPAEGRFLWDLNVYNIYPQQSNGCGFGGGYYGNRPFNGGFFQNFLSLFVPGGVLNPNPLRPLQSPIRPIQSDSVSNLPAGVQNDPSIDPLLDSTGTGGTSTGAVGGSGTTYAAQPSLTPGQIVGGVATTVNGIIQQLSGNTQPVYRRYG